MATIPLCFEFFRSRVDVLQILADSLRTLSLRALSICQNWQNWTSQQTKWAFSRGFAEKPSPSCILPYLGFD